MYLQLRRCKYLSFYQKRELWHLPKTRWLQIPSNLPKIWEVRHVPETSRCFFIYLKHEKRELSATCTCNQGVVGTFYSTKKVSCDMYLRPSGYRNLLIYPKHKVRRVLETERVMYHKVAPKKNCKTVGPAFGGPEFFEKLKRSWKNNWCFIKLVWLSFDA